MKTKQHSNDDDKINNNNNNILPHLLTQGYAKITRSLLFQSSFGIYPVNSYVYGRMKNIKGGVLFHLKI